MNTEDLQLVLVRYSSDTGLISLAAQAILCHTVDSGDGGLEWPKGIPVADFSEESRFTRLLGQDPDEPRHNWEDVLAYVLSHQRELGLGDHFVAQSPCTRVVTMQVACMAEDAEDVKQSLFDEKGQCWYLDHHCPLGPIKVGIRLPTAVEEVAARDALDADETNQRRAMPKTKKAKDDIRTPLEKMLKNYGCSAGTDLGSAIRDLLTELMHVCDDDRVNFAGRLHLARKVYRQERSTEHLSGDEG